MGVVHLARDRQGGLVAVKVLHQLDAEDPNARRRLGREVETMRRVRSPFVAEVLDADVTGEFPYIVTRYVAGPTLDEMVRNRGPLPGPGLRRLAYGTAEALAAIHAAGVVHRDLKPGNVMLAEDRPIVIDFGIAQAGDATRLTQTGLVMGTPGYLAPEVIEGQPSSPASDVHCWGATLAFAATGHLPFGAGSYESIFYRIVSGRADLEGVPAPLVPLISAALARDPAHRPSASWLGAQASALEPQSGGPHPTTAGTSPLPPAGDAAQKRRKPPGPPWPGDQLERYQRQREQWRQDQELANRASYPGQAPQQPQPAPWSPQGSQPQGSQPRGSQPQGSQPQGSQPQGSQPQGPQPQGPQPQGPQPQGPQARLPQAPGQFGPPAKPPPRPNTMAGLAVMVAAVALTVVLPVAGLVVSLAVITLLRAADRAQAALAVRRSVRGPRASDLLLVLITAPLTVARAVLTEALMAPLAFIAAAVVYGATVVATHSLDMPRAGAYAAAAVVAWYGIAPGSGKPRRQLNRMAGVLARNRMSTAVTALAVWGLAAAAVLFASSQTPYYWPAVAPHLPGLHSLITSAASWLLQHTHA
jgi:serine/threonine protein kinase